MSDRESPESVAVNPPTGVCSDAEQTPEFCDENPGSEFVEPAEGK